MLCAKISNFWPNLLATSISGVWCFLTIPTNIINNIVNHGATPLFGDLVFAWFATIFLGIPFILIVWASVNFLRKMIAELYYQIYDSL